MRRLRHLTHWSPLWRRSTQPSDTINLDLHNKLIEQERRNGEATLAASEAEWRKATLAERARAVAAEAQLVEAANPIGWPDNTAGSLTANGVCDV